jgi:RecB family endonuclease NucS
MKGIKLWEIKKNEKNIPFVNEIKTVDQTETEEQLEDVLVTCPDLISTGLRLVGRQTETEGGPLDLLGVDLDGNLVVCELKRGSLTREAIAQIIDYSSNLAELEPEDLAAHISEQSENLGGNKIDNFSSWYQENFGKSVPKFQKPKMILIGLGADDRTRRMVSFLAQGEIDISLITFHGFEEAGKTLLAKQVEIEGRPPVPPAVTKKGNLEKLQQKIKKMGIEEYYDQMAAFVRDQFTAYEWPNQGGFSYYLPEMTESGSESNRLYMALYVHEKHSEKVEIRIHQRAVSAASSAFEPLKKKLGDKIKMRSDGGAEIWVKNMKQWEEIQPYFKEICSAVYTGWKKKREQEVIKEHQEAEQSLAKEGS